MAELPSVILGAVCLVPSQSLSGVRVPEPLQGPPGERLCGVLGGSAAGILWPDVRGAGLWPGEGQAQATPRCALPWLMVLLGTGINLFGGLGPRGSLEVSRSYPSEHGPDQKVGALMGRHVTSSVCRPRPTEPQGREQTPPTPSVECPPGRCRRDPVCQR